MNAITQNQIAEITFEDFLMVVDIFSLLKMRKSAEADKQQVVASIKQETLADFVDNDLEGLLTPEQIQEFDKLLEQPTSDLDSFLQTTIPDIQERLAIKTLEIKFRLFTDLLSSLWATSQEKKKILTSHTTPLQSDKFIAQLGYEINTLDEMITCIEQEQWGRLIQLLEPFNELDLTATAKAVLAA